MAAEGPDSAEQAAEPNASLQVDTAPRTKAGDPFADAGIDEFSAHVFLAQVAEAANRGADMWFHVKQFVACAAAGTCLRRAERNLLAVALKSEVQRLRHCMVVMASMDMDPSASDMMKQLVTRRRTQALVPQLAELVQDGLRIVKPLSVGGSLDDEGRVFYAMLLGDLHRYNTEVLEGEDQDLAADDASTAYGNAIELAAELPQYHPVVLTLWVSYSLFLYDVMGHHEQACRSASSAFHGAHKALVGAPKQAVVAAAPSLKQLADNVTLWLGKGSGSLEGAAAAVPPSRDRSSSDEDE